MEMFGVAVAPGASVGVEDVAVAAVPPGVGVGVALPHAAATATNSIDAAARRAGK
jgi:hypothetical protein